MRHSSWLFRSAVLVALAGVPQRLVNAQAPAATTPDTLAIVSVARTLAADSMRGRGPWTRDATRAAQYLATRLAALGARPVLGKSLLVPVTSEPHPRDTVYNVVGVLPNVNGSTVGDWVGLTAHLDHLGVGAPDARGDTIYNGFLDDAMGIAMILDVARRYRASPGPRPLVILFFNLEEQGLLGAKAMVERPDAQTLIDHLKLLVGVDAGSPAGEALEWQLMGGSPTHRGTIVADSLARLRGWTTTSTPPRGINDVFVFAQRGVPILFPIPGKTWRGYTPEQHDEAMRRFDHYHQPADEYNPAFPLVGTWYFADWVYRIVMAR